MNNTPQPPYHVYVGSYTDQASSGIYLYTMDSQSGKLAFVDSVSGIENPAFLFVDGGQRHLYAVSEVEQYRGQIGGAVASYKLDGHAGTMAYMNERATDGGASCHLMTDALGRLLFVANYSGGSIAMYPVEEDGSIGPMCDFVQHEGKGPREDRQEAPHPHSVFLYQEDRYVFAPDLGLDKVFIYRIDYEARKFNLHGEASLPAGAGPRHLEFHPSGNFVYVINELDSTVSVFSIQPDSCTLEHLQNISTLPADFTGETTCADIHMTPDANFLYASNRGHDSLAIYKINPSDGSLTAVGFSPTYGMTPRNFAITPDGRFVLAANQDSDTINILAIDPDTGHLTLIPELTIEVSKPVCVKIVERQA